MNGSYQPSEELILHEIPLTQWEKVTTYLFQLKNKYYLIVTNYTSICFEVSAPLNTLSSTVVKHTKSIFARFGIPKIVISDNGLQLFLQQYKTFAKKWGFQNNTSSPLYTKSNGSLKDQFKLQSRQLRKLLTAVMTLV